jgi:CRISPR-associated endonuclease/helicase Cas3
MAKLTLFFQKVFGDTCSPYDYQIRLAGGDDGTDCHSQLINIQTGLGKTAAVVLAWLWNRVQLQNPKWPRRLVYCLPMRTLVEQTEKNVREWLATLKLDAVGVHVLMGGEESEDWDLYPEHNAILVGTQDMLLSRALNRGYGMSRYRWPMQFGLLNNDCLWVMDETQLMGVGVETSAQIDGFRHLAGWTNDKNCPTWWMSATLDEDRLATVDHPKPAGGWDKIILSDADRAADGVRERFEAGKPVTKAGLVLNADTKKVYAVHVAKLIAEKHQSESLTLVVVNRVARALEIYAALQKLKSDSLNPDHIALIHSRFRPIDRTRHTKLLFGDGDRIVIATQAVEAGVDVSARLLITELAPWSSLVQRFGRCNRQGKIRDAEAIWIDIPPENDDLCLPYLADDLKKTGEEMQKLRDAGIKSLGSVRVSETPVIRPVLRRRDLIDLFDTTPDLCGQDLDISRYIRDGEDSDVQFFWRNIGENIPTAENTSPPHRDELCRVSIGDAHKFIDKQSTRAWQWNSLEEVWQKIERVRPGAVYLIDVASGGYDDNLGWTGEPKNKPTPCPPVDGDAESYRKDPQTFARYWLPLDHHTQHVVATATALMEALSFVPAMTVIFTTAAHWHDVGKAHDEFQKALRVGPHQPDDVEAFYAKSKNPYNPKAMAKERRGFRHELASALAWLSAGPADTTERDLIAYLIAAHHGKVRLSIRALPDEKGNPANPDGLYARGIWHEDKLPAVPSFLTQPVTLDLRLMQMGEGEHGPSWLARMIGLRDRLGPFRLAYLETLLRAADIRASREESEHLSEVDCAVRDQRTEKPKET